MKHIYILAAMLISTLTLNAQTSVDPGTNPGDTGTVNFTYKGNSVQYTTVRAEDGNIWLQQNLGSTQVATSLTDADAYGDLFQWGRWDDGHQLRTSTLSNTAPTPNNPTGLGTGTDFFYGTDPEWWNNPGEAAITDTWDAPTPDAVTATSGCDPCRALGDGWHMPSQPEWAAVIAAEPITSQATGLSSNLKIAAAGSRSYTGNLNSVGTRAYIWTATPSETNVNFAKYYYLTNLTNNANAGGYREQGNSVRCMKLAAAAGTKGYNMSTAAIYPNPVLDTATIQSAEAVQQYEVFTITGALVQKGTGNTIATESFTKGMYIVKITFENGTVHNTKIVKE